MNRLSASALVLTAMLPVACDPAADADSQLSSTAQAAPSVFVDATELMERLESDPPLVLELGSDTERYDEGHLPTARFLSSRDLVVEADGVPNELPPLDQLVDVLARAGVSNERETVVYGPPLLAARAWVTLDVLGLGDRTSILAGGSDAWTRAGGMLTTDTPESAPAILAVAPDLTRIVSADWIRDRLDRTGVAVLDARPEAQYTGEVPGGGVERPGHIAGAPWVYWEDLRTEAGPLAGDSLRAIFASAGATPGDTVVAYCRTGVQASYLYAVARSLGYEARLYDASYIDWSGRADLPVRSGVEP